MPAPLWDKRLNRTVEQIKPSGIRQFFDIVAARKDCISLGVGEPDFVSPRPVIEQAITALRDGFTHYTGNQGLLSLRTAITDYLDQEYGVRYDPASEVLVTVGVSEAVDLAFRATLNAGDAVLYPQPSYVSYEPMIALAGGTPLPCYARRENNFELLYEDIVQAYAPKAKILFLNYPANPTGSSMSRETLLKVADFAREKDLLVISDEIYGELTYESRHLPFSTLPGMKERTLLLGGFSKAFAMTGWRVGYACGPAEIIRAMTKIHQFSMLCAPTISQIAAEAALKYALEDRDRMKQAYHLRRDRIVNGFNAAGLPCYKPAGAFYVFPDIRSTGLSSMEFASQLLDAENVAVVPGTAFGATGEGFIRCSYATSMEEIEKALFRINRFVRTLR